MAFTVNGNAATETVHNQGKQRNTCEKENWNTKDGVDKGRTKRSTIDNKTKLANPCKGKRTCTDTSKDKHKTKCN